MGEVLTDKTFNLVNGTHVSLLWYANQFLWSFY